MYVHVRVHVCVSAVQELTQLQDKHATRPDVFDDVEEEQEIEILTQEITQVPTVNCSLADRNFIHLMCVHLEGTCMYNV